MSSSFFPSYYKLKVAPRRNAPTHSTVPSRYYFCVECDRGYLSASSLCRHFSSNHKSIKDKQEIHSPSSATSPSKPANQSPETSPALKCRSESPKEKTCPLCSTPLGRTSYARHLISEHNTEPFLCTVCGTRFSEYKTLGHHKNTHCDGLQRKHELLSSSSQGENSESRPRPSEQVDTRNVLKCEYCPREFSKLTHMFVHSIGHASSIPFLYQKNRTKFMCDMCTSKFFHQKHIGSHLYTHRDQLKCKSCGEQCFFLEDLNRHEKQCERTVNTFVPSSSCDGNTTISKELEFLDSPSAEDVQKPSMDILPNSSSTDEVF